MSANDIIRTLFNVVKITVIDLIIEICNFA